MLMCFSLPCEGCPSLQLSSSLKSQEEVQACKKWCGHGQHQMKAVGLGLALVSFHSSIYEGPISVHLVRSSFRLLDTRNYSSEHKRKLLFNLSGCKNF